MSEMLGVCTTNYNYDFRSPNKIVCFTRSSPLIHALPTQFPHSTSQQDPNTMFKSVGHYILDDTKMLSNMVFAETEKLVLQKLSALQSQSSAQEFLANFLHSKSAEVCILLANMEETTINTINHIRVMIEEAEQEAASSATPACCKMFSLLLHFPPSQFFQHCYPALSLKGWDHCYLDTIAHSVEEGLVDIKDWFFKCCFPTEQPGLDESDTLLQALKRFLPQSVSVISARITFGSKKDGSFNSIMNATERSNSLKALFEKGLSDILCDRFRDYWKPKVMVECMENAARFSKEMESTLNITETIQMQFKDLFVDFCVYMLTRANENYNLDIVYTEQPGSPRYELFMRIFKIWPIHSHFKNVYTQSSHQLNSPCFPFFSIVYELLEDLVKSCGMGVNLQLDILADKEGTDETFQCRNNPASKLQKLIKAVLNELKPHPEVSY